MTNDTLVDVTSNPKVSPSVSIAIVCVTVLPILVNISYIVVCFQALKKDFNDLLVLSLCFSDVLLGLSLVWFILSQMIPYTKNNIRSCQFSLFIGCFILVLTYSLICMLCLVRYLSVKSYNYGIREKFNRKKFSLIGGVFGFGFLITSIGTLAIPCQNTIEGCSSTQLYGKYNLYFVLIVMGTVTLLVVLIVAITLGTSYQLWAIFFRPKNKVNPQNRRSLTSETSEKKRKCRCAWKETLANLQTTTQRIDSDAVSLERSKLDENSCPRDVANINVDSAVEVLPSSSGTMTGPTQSTVSSSKQQNKGKYGKAWEAKAFVTNVIIASTTLLLTGPFVATYWYDIVFNTSIPSQTRLIIFVLCSMNCVVNPFVYAWRIPEIRQQFKKIFKIK